MRRTLNVLMMLALVLLLSTSVMAQGRGNGNGGGNNGGDDGGDGGDTTPSPSTRYEVVAYQLPTNDGGQPLDINNVGQVVGFFYRDGIELAYLAELQETTGGTMAAEVLELDQLVAATDSIPDGYWISKARDINDRGVIVGQLSNLAGDSLPFALDLSETRPVVDLLPSALGEMAYHINNAGDVIGTCECPDGSQTVWLADLSSYYGDPTVYPQASRSLDSAGNVLPFDLSTISTVKFEQILGASRLGLSERASNDLVYVSGTIGATPFRIAVPFVGTSNVEIFADLFVASGGQRIAGITSTGVWAAYGSIPSGRKKRQSGIYVYDTSAEILQQADVTFGSYVRDINEFEDLLMGTDVLFRDWLDGNGRRYVRVSDLVDSGDLESWQYFDQRPLLTISETGFIHGELFRTQKFADERGPKFILVPYIPQ